MTPRPPRRSCASLLATFSFDALAGAIASGYQSSLGETRRRELTAIESAQARRRVDRNRRDILNRAHQAVAGGSPTLRNRIASQLGAIEAAIALNADGTIEAARLSGDFIANSPAIAELESELRGRPLDLASVSQAVAKTFGGIDSDNFFLGAGELSNLVRLIANVN